MIHPMLYELEQAYHVYREPAAAHQRRAGGTELRITARTFSTRIHYLVRGRLQWVGLRGIRALAWCPSLRRCAAQPRRNPGSSSSKEWSLTTLVPTSRKRWM